MPRKGMPKKGFIGVALVLMLAIGFYIFTRHSTDASEGNDEGIIHITCGMVGLEYKTCQEGVALWEKKTGKRAKVIPAPNGSTERLTLFQQHLAAESDNIDIYQVDVVWPGLLANHFEDLKNYIPEEELTHYFPQLLENNTVNGKLMAMPWAAPCSAMPTRSTAHRPSTKPRPRGCATRPPPQSQRSAAHSKPATPWGCP